MNAAHGAPGAREHAERDAHEQPHRVRVAPEVRARDGSPVGDTSTPIHTVDATAPTSAITGGAHGPANDAPRRANSTSGSTT